MMSRVLKTLPVGYRFDPTDEELIHYLKLKIGGMDSQVGIIPEVDLCKWEPWQLPGKNKLNYLSFNENAFRFILGCS